MKASLLSSWLQGCPPHGGFSPVSTASFSSPRRVSTCVEASLSELRLGLCLCPRLTDFNGFRRSRWADKTPGSRVQPQPFPWAHASSCWPGVSGHLQLHLATQTLDFTLALPRRTRPNTYRGRNVGVSAFPTAETCRYETPSAARSNGAPLVPRPSFVCLSHVGGPTS